MDKVQRHRELMQAFENAQRIAFAPFIFQAVIAARDLGILPFLGEQRKAFTIEAIAAETKVSPYGVKVLAELLACAGVLAQDENGAFSLTKTGYCLIYDTMTEVHLNFSNDVNYQALAYTAEAVREGKAAGLKVFDPEWKTIYPHLKDLPTKAQDAWFAFDHFHSDMAFRAALRVLERVPVKCFFDVGGNTGRFARMALETWREAYGVIVDLPEQLELMRANPEVELVRERLDGTAINWLDETAEINHSATPDLIWMSQFLDCFSPDQAVSILRRAAKKLGRGGRIVIMESLWDAQRNDTAALSLTAGSLYFTVLANGNSRFFSRIELEAIIAKAGLTVEAVHDNLGVSHSLYICTLP